MRKATEKQLFGSTVLLRYRRLRLNKDKRWRRGHSPRKSRDPLGIAGRSDREYSEEKLGDESWNAVGVMR